MPLLQSDGLRRQVRWGSDNVDATGGPKRYANHLILVDMCVCSLKASRLNNLESITCTTGYTMYEKVDDT